MGQKVQAVMGGNIKSSLNWYDTDRKFGGEAETSDIRTELTPLIWFTVLNESSKKEKVTLNHYIIIWHSIKSKN